MYLNWLLKVFSFIRAPKELKDSVKYLFEDEVNPVYNYGFF